MLPRVRHAATRNRIEKNKTTSGSYPLVGSFTKKQVSVQKNTFALDPGWGSPKKAVRATATKNNNRPPLNNKKRARNDKLKGTFGSPLCFLGFTIWVAQHSSVWELAIGIYTTLQLSMVTTMRSEPLLICL